MIVRKIICKNNIENNLENKIELYVRPSITCCTVRTGNFFLNFVLSSSKVCIRNVQ